MFEARKRPAPKARAAWVLQPYAALPGLSAVYASVSELRVSGRTWGSIDGSLSERNG
jgi:hypothetical protein